MARRPTGTIDIEVRANGTRAFRLRFRVHGERHSVFLHERRDCACGCGGGWTERTARQELDNVLARVKAGIWERPKVEPHVAKAFTVVPTFRDYSSCWLKAKLEGLIGEKPIAKSTYNGYLTALTQHLWPFFGHYPVDVIDQDLCVAFKKHLVKTAYELREAIAAGADLRDERNRKLVPLGPASIRGNLILLAQILDEAVEDGHLDVNPARSRRLRIHVPRPKRTFLEIDELAYLEDSARAQDPPLALFKQAAMEAPAGSTRAAVARAASEGKSQAAIVRELGLAKGSVSYDLKRLNLGAIKYVGRGAIVSTLGYSGLRVSELCDLKIGQLRLHDAEQARLLILDAKTETGIREVEMSPDLVDVIRVHLDRLCRYGRSITPNDYVFQNGEGGRWSRQSVAKIVTEASIAASEAICKQGLPALPHTTPHTMRRTYISIALLANNFDIVWVMKQVGHASSKMTLEVYAQLQQRVRRENGVRFDALVRKAREQLVVRPEAPMEQPIGSALGSGTPDTRRRSALTTHRHRDHRASISRQNLRLRDSKLNSEHQRFQSSALPTELSRRDPRS